MSRRFLASATLFVAIAFTAIPPATRAQTSEALEIDPRPKIFVTDFTWYRPNEKADGSLDEGSLACARAQPRRALGNITATDYLSSEGYYGEKYKRYKRRGVDGIAFLMTDRVPDSFAGSNLVAVSGLAKEAGLQFFAYYDLFVRSAKESKLILCLPGSQCRLPTGTQRIPSFNINASPQLYEQLRNDFRSLAEHVIVPHMDPVEGGEADGGGYLMLEDADGQRVVDEEGLPRPVIALYIARELSDKPASQTRLGELMAEVTEIFRGFGLGRPAMVLDVLFWATRTEENLDLTYDAEIVEAFGESAVAITWYSFFDPYRGGLKNITNDGPRPPISVWGKFLHQRYTQAREEMAANGHELMLWPGAQTQMDTRVADVKGCQQRSVEIAYHLRDREDWRTMLDRAYRNTARPTSGTPLQTMVIVTNAGEWREVGALDYTHRDSSGECSYPYNWCTDLLDVIAEEDRYP
jgi:hypothetical protein